jgi:hypothetical protein
VLAVKYSSGHFIKFLFLNLDANNMRWEASSTSDIQVRYVGNVEVPVAVHWNELRLIVYSRLGTPARIGTDYNQDRMILIFDQDKIDDMPAFKRKLENSVKRLIALCGGKVEAKDPFD